MCRCRKLACQLYHVYYTFDVAISLCTCNTDSNHDNCTYYIMLLSLLKSHNYVTMSYHVRGGPFDFLGGEG